MSTIDIGIAELPAQPVTKVALSVQPLRHRSARTFASAAIPQVSTSVDFYVGSVKLDAMPSNAQVAQARLLEPVF